MSQLSQERIRAKINQVRAEVPKPSNDEIVLVLQHYDNDVEQTINAFLEDGAREALQQWHYSGSSKAPTSKKKKKKNKKSANDSTPAVGNGPTMNGNVDHTTLLTNGCAAADHSVSSTESVEGTASGASTPARVVMTTPVIDVSMSLLLAASQSADAVKLPLPQETAMVQMPVIVTVQPSGSVPASNAPTVSIPAAPVVAPAKTRHNVSNDYQHTSKKGRDRATSETATTVGPTTETASSSSHTTITKKPHAGLEKSVKDLHRQTVSLERLKVVLNENIDKSFKRLSEVFKELYTVLHERESQLFAELTEAKQQANDILQEQQAKALSLKCESDRAHTDQELSQIRANIKHFVSERKVYEDLSLAQRFTCDVTTVFDAIRNIGEVTPVKLPPSDAINHPSVLPSGELQRQQSDIVSDLSSAPPTPSVVEVAALPVATPVVAAAAADEAAATASSLHVLTQSDSLTRYELQVGSKPGTNSNVNAGSVEHRRRNDSSRGRGSPRRGSGGRGGGQDGRKVGGRGPPSEGHGPNYSASRTFVSRNLSGGAASGDERNSRKSSPDLAPKSATTTSAAATEKSAGTGNVSAPVVDTAVVCNGNSSHQQTGNSAGNNNSSSSSSNFRLKNTGDRSSGQDRAGGRAPNSGRGGSRSNNPPRNGYQKPAFRNDGPAAPLTNGKTGNGNSNGNSASVKVNGDHNPGRVPDDSKLSQPTKSGSQPASKLESKSDEISAPEALPQRTNNRRSRPPPVANGHAAPVLTPVAT